MKLAVQYYALLFVFTIGILIIPTLLNFSICFNNLNQTSTHVVEIIEVNEGVNDNANNIINEIRSNNPETLIDIEKIKVTNNYNIYKVLTSRKLNLGILNLSYDLTSSKKSRRVLY